ncbi:MAG: TolC family protein, partial [Gammaproteobacteria bacterium]|nr:TolC family protein [Gammaproteobacteria bacterium]
MPVETPVTVQDAFESALSIDPEVQSALKRIEAFKARRSAASALTA